MNIGPGANACALKRKKGGFKRVGTEVPKKGCLLFILNSSASHCSESPWFKEQGGVGKSAPPHPFSPQVLPCLWLNSFENWGENLHPVTLGIQLSDVWGKDLTVTFGQDGFWWPQAQSWGLQTNWRSNPCHLPRVSDILSQAKMESGKGDPSSSLFRSCKWPPPSTYMSCPLLSKQKIWVLSIPQHNIC